MNRVILTLAGFLIALISYGQITIDTPIATDDIVNSAESASLTISGTSSGTLGGETVEVTIGGVTENTTVMGADGIWSVVLDISGLADASLMVAAVLDPSGTPDNATNNNYPITLDQSSPTPVISSTEIGPTNANPIPVTVNFFEAVTGFDGSDLVIVNGTAGTISDDGGGQFSFDLTPSGDGVVTVDIGVSQATDLAGNDNLAATQFSITFDSSGPTPMITSMESGSTNINPIPVTVDFGEAVTGFTIGDLSITNGSAGGFSDDGGGMFSFDLTPAGDGLVTVDIGAGIAADIAGNLNAAATQFSITFDSSGPTPIISSMESGSTNINPIPVTVDFGEAVTGFTIGDLSITNGSAGGFSDDGGGMFSFDLTPSSDGVVTVDIAAAAANDLGANPSEAATQFVITSDQTAPTISSFNLSGGNTYVDVTFSEGIYANDGTSPVVAGDFMITNFSDGGSASATSVAITGITNTAGEPLVGGESTIRVEIDVAPDVFAAENDDVFEIQPANGSSVYDQALNAMLATETTTPIALNVVDAGNKPTLLEVLPDQTNSILRLVFSDEVDANGSGNGFLRIRDDGGRELDSDNYNDPGGNTTFSIANQGLTTRTGDAGFVGDGNSGNIWQLNLTVGGTNAAGDEIFDLDILDNEILKSQNPGSGTPMDAVTQVVTLADALGDSFTGASANALDSDADGNIDQVDVVMPDNIIDATVTLTDFSFGGVSPSGFDTDGVADNNTFTLFFDSYAGSGVATLTYTQGTLQDDAQSSSFDATQGNLIATGSITPTDAAGPIILEAETQDADQNGKIDQILITFSEPFDDLGIDETDFTLSNPSYTVASTAPLVASPTVTVYLDEIPGVGVYDTDVTFDLTAAAGILEDQSVQPDGADFTGQTLTVSDGAPPFASVNGPISTNSTDPELTGVIDDVDGSIIVSIGGNTVNAINNGDGTWTLPAGSLPSDLSTTGSPYDVLLTTIDTDGNVGSINTPAHVSITGGVVITAASLETMCVEGDFQEITDPIIISEAAATPDGIGSSGNIVLTLPVGFEFDVTQTPDFATGSTFSGDLSIDQETSSDPEQTQFAGAGSLSIEIDVTGTSGQDEIHITNLWVRAVGPPAVAEPLTRTGGDLSISTGETVYATFTSDPAPDPITSITIDGTSYSSQYAHDLIPTTQINYSLTSGGPYLDGETVNFSGGASGVVVTGTNTGTALNIFPSTTTAISDGEVMTGMTSGATAMLTSSSSSGNSVLESFTMIVNPGVDNAVWRNRLGMPINVDSGGDTQQTMADNTELGINSPGVYTYDVSVDDGVCENSPLRFNVLVYEDIDGEAVGSNTFVDRSFITSQSRDTIFVTQPSNHTVSVTGIGISSQLQSSNNPSSVYRMYFFDPNLAGPGTHTITYTTTNDLSGESVTLQVDFTVTLPIDFFEEIALPDNICASEMPLALTIDKSSFLPGQDLNFIYFENHTNGSPFMGYFWYAFNNEFPGYTGNPATSVYEFEFDFRSSYVATDPELDWDRFGNSHELDAGEAYAYRVERALRDPFVNPTDFLFVYGEPSVFISNVEEAYCRDDDPFSIERIATYVEGFTADDPDDQYTQWTPNTISNEVAVITTGYELWTESTPGSGTYNVLWEDFTEVGQGPGNAINEFDPSDPNQNGMFDAGEAQNYRIIYTTEPLTGAGCSGTATFDLTVSPADPTPALSASTILTGSSTGFFNNSSPEDGVDADEYVLEYCVGDVLPTISIEDNGKYNYEPIRTATASFRLNVFGAAFQVGETVRGQVFGGKAIVTAVSPTTIEIASIVGIFRIGETVIGLNSGAKERLTNYVENSLTNEFIIGLSSGATATITELGDGRFAVTGQSGFFQIGETFEGSSTNARGELRSLGEVSWYNSSFARINAIENRNIVASGSLGINSGAGAQLTEQSVEFYVSTTSVAGCESDLRKVTVHVYPIPDVPDLELGSFPAEVQNGNGFIFDYCVENDGSSVNPDDLSLGDLAVGESYNVSRAFRDASTGTETIASVTLTEPGSDTDRELVNVPNMFAGDTIIYTITKTENISSESYSDFPGCTGSPILIGIVAHEEATNVSESDFNNNTTEFFICEGDILPNIAHTFIDGVDEYIWYDDVNGSNNGINQIGDPLEAGDAMTQSVLVSASTPFSNTTPGVYTYYVSRNNDVVTDRGFSGCESEAVPVVITVFAQQDAPEVLSDNTANASVPNFSNQDPDDDDHFEFAVCSDQIFADLTFQATNLYSGDERVEWYNENTGALLFVGEQPTFNNLGLLGQGVGTVSFEIYQVTDTLTDSFGNYFDGCQSLTATMDVIISDPASLSVQLENTDPVLANYCRDDDPLGNGGNVVLSLLAGGMEAVTIPSASVEHDILSYTKANYDVGGAASVTTANISGDASLDLDALHDAVTGSQAVGGNPTVHEVIYTYVDPTTFCESNITQVITVYPDPNISFTLNEINANNLEFVYDDAPVSLEGLTLDANTIISLGTGSYSINTGGLANTTNNRGEFNPRVGHENVRGSNQPYADQSAHRITYSFEDELGCDRDTSLTVFVNPLPEIRDNEIKVVSTCADADIVIFVQLEDNEYGEGEEFYDFTWFVNGEEAKSAPGTARGDTLDYDLVEVGGSANFSVEVTYNPAYGGNFNTSASSSVLNQQIVVGAVPEPSVSWVGTTAGSPDGTTFIITEDNPDLIDGDVEFVELLVNGESQEIFADPTFPIIYEYDNTSPGYSFGTPGDYPVQVIIETGAGCVVDDFFRTITIIDHLTGLSSYTESFETDNGGWTIETLSLDGKRNDLVTSWEIGSNYPDLTGTPDGLPDGANAVYTNGYQPSEASYVYSPSLDLRAFDAPAVSFLRLEDFENERDGVVFQMTTDDGRTWENVGTFDDLLPDGLESTPGWYNEDGITAEPGRGRPGDPNAPFNPQGIGWAENTDWQLAQAPLSIPDAEKDFVRFRFAIAAQGGIKTTQGFAFDQIKIYEREKIVLVEQFSSSLNPDSYDVNQTIDGLTAYNGNDVVRINYFTDFANAGSFNDEINTRNSKDPGARSTFYGVEDVPSITISGVTTLLEDPLQLQNEIQARLVNSRLEDPGFDISISANIDAESILTVAADFTSRADIESPSSELSLCLAIIEPEIEVNATTGPIGFYQVGDRITNVLRKILPSSAGQYVAGSIAVGEVLRIDPIEWPITNLYSTDTLAVVAYVQDLNTKNILQSAVLGLDNPNANLALGVGSALSASDIQLYPNPADQQVTVDFGGQIFTDTDWTIYDQAGREITKGKIQQGSERLQISTEEMPSGLYFMNLYNDEGQPVVKRMMVLH